MSSETMKIAIGDNVLAAFAIASLVLLEVAAMNAGINGKLFTVVVAAVAGLGGYSINNLLRSRVEQPPDRETAQ